MSKLTQEQFVQLLWNIRVDDQLLGQIDEAVAHDAALRVQLELKDQMITAVSLALQEAGCHMEESGSDFIIRQAAQLAQVTAEQNELTKEDIDVFMPALRLKITQGGLSIAEQFHLHKLARRLNHKYKEVVRLLANVNTERIKETYDLHECRQQLTEAQSKCL